MGNSISLDGSNAPTLHASVAIAQTADTLPKPRVLQVFKSAVFKSREAVLYEHQNPQTDRYEIRVRTLHPDARKIDDMLVAERDTPAKDSDFGYSSQLTRSLKATVRRLNAEANVIPRPSPITVGNPWDALVGGGLDLVVGTVQTVVGLPEKLLDSSIAFGGSVGALAEATFSEITGIDAPADGLSNTLNAERRSQFAEDSSVDAVFNDVRRATARRLAADPDSVMFKAGEYLSMFVQFGKKGKGKTAEPGPRQLPGQSPGPALNRGLDPDFVRQVKSGIEAAPKSEVIAAVGNMTPEFVHAMRQRTPDVYDAIVARLRQFGNDQDVMSALARLSGASSAAPVRPRIPADPVPGRLPPAADASPPPRPAVSGAQMAQQIGQNAYPFSGIKPLVYGDVVAAQQQAMLDNAGQNRLVSVAVPFSYRDPSGLTAKGALLYRGVDVAQVKDGLGGALSNLANTASFEVPTHTRSVLAGSGLSLRGLDQRIGATGGGEPAGWADPRQQDDTPTTRPEPVDNMFGTPGSQGGQSSDAPVSPSLDRARRNTPTGPSAPFAAVTPKTPAQVNVPDPLGQSGGFTLTPSGKVQRNDPPPQTQTDALQIPDAITDTNTPPPGFSDQYKPIYKGVMQGVRSNMAHRARALEDAHRANRDLVNEAKRHVGAQRQELRHAEQALRQWDRDPSPLRTVPREQLVADVDARRSHLEAAENLLATAEKKVRDNDVRLLSPSVGISVGEIMAALDRNPAGVAFGELHRSAPFFNLRTFKSLLGNRAALGQAISTGDVTRLRQIVGEAMGLSMHNLQGLRSPTLATDNIQGGIEKADDLVSQVDVPVSVTNMQLQRSYLQITSQTLHSRPDLFVPTIQNGVTNYALNVEPVELAAGQSGFFGSSQSPQYYRLAADWDIDKAAKITETPFIMSNQQEWKRVDGADMRIPKGAILPKEFVDRVNARIGDVEANLRIFSAPGKPLSSGWKIDIPFENRLDRQVNQTLGQERTNPVGPNEKPINPVDVLTAPFALEGRHTVRSIKTFSLDAVVDDVLTLAAGGKANRALFLAHHPEIAAAAVIIKSVFPKAQVVTGALPRPLERPSAQVENGPVRVELLTPAGDAITPTFNPKRILKITDTGKLASDADLPNGGRSEPTRRGHVTPSPIGQLTSISVGGPEGITRDKTLVLMGQGYATMVPEALAVSLEGKTLPPGGARQIIDFLDTLPQQPDGPLGAVDFEQLKSLLRQQQEGTSVRGMARVELLLLMRELRDADISTGIGVSAGR